MSYGIIILQSTPSTTLTLSLCFGYPLSLSLSLSLSFFSLFVLPPSLTPLSLPFPFLPFLSSPLLLLLRYFRCPILPHNLPFFFLHSYLSDHPIPPHPTHPFIHATRIPSPRPSSPDHPYHDPAR
ncbi:hypothetical protein F4778DRAFT_587901 [Xylariomycetidae sp. FL2044]|nr:hypothetical protein F4778DRAFT_587901 [Xylariomycetidae sp. FL2044]